MTNIDDTRDIWDIEITTPDGQQAKTHEAAILIAHAAGWVIESVGPFEYVGQPTDPTKDGRIYGCVLDGGADWTDHGPYGDVNVPAN